MNRKRGAAAASANQQLETAYLELKWAKYHKLLRQVATMESNVTDEHLKLILKEWLFQAAPVSTKRASVAPSKRQTTLTSFSALSDEDFLQAYIVANAEKRKELLETTNVRCTTLQRLCAMFAMCKTGAKNDLIMRLNSVRDRILLPKELHKEGELQFVGIRIEETWYAVDETDNIYAFWDTDQNALQPLTVERLQWLKAQGFTHVKK